MFHNELSIYRQPCLVVWEAEHWGTLMCLCSVRDQQSVNQGTGNLSQQEPKCGCTTDQRIQLCWVLSYSHLWSDANQLPNWQMQRMLPILKCLNTVSWLRSKTRAENWKHAFIRLYVHLYLCVYNPYKPCAFYKILLYFTMFNYQIYVVYRSGKIFLF